jgi:hypothetical protein
MTSCVMLCWLMDDAHLACTLQCSFATLFYHLVTHVLTHWVNNVLVLWWSGFVLSHPIGCMLSHPKWMTIVTLHSVLLGLYIDPLQAIWFPHSLTFSLSRPYSLSLLRSFFLSLCLSSLPFSTAALSVAALSVQNHHRIIDNFLFLSCLISFSLLFSLPRDQSCADDNLT